MLDTCLISAVLGAYQSTSWLLQKQMQIGRPRAAAALTCAAGLCTSMFASAHVANCVALEPAPPSKHLDAEAAVYVTGCSLHSQELFCMLCICSCMPAHTAYLSSSQQTDCGLHYEEVI